VNDQDARTLPLDGVVPVQVTGERHVLVHVLDGLGLHLGQRGLSASEQDDGSDCETHGEIPWINDS
jgi:hypothetical protein